MILVGLLAPLLLHAGGNSIHAAAFMTALDRTRHVAAAKLERRHRRRTARRLRLGTVPAWPRGMLDSAFHPLLALETYGEGVSSIMYWFLLVLLVAVAVGVVIAIGRSQRAH